MSTSNIGSPDMTPSRVDPSQQNKNARDKTPISEEEQQVQEVAAKQIGPERKITITDPQGRTHDFHPESSSERKITITDPQGRTHDFHLKNSSQGHADIRALSENSLSEESIANILETVMNLDEKEQGRWIIEAAKQNKGWLSLQMIAARAHVTHARDEEGMALMHILVQNNDIDSIREITTNKVFDNILAKLLYDPGNEKMRPLETALKDKNYNAFELILDAEGRRPNLHATPQIFLAAKYDDPKGLDIIIDARKIRKDNIPFKTARAFGMDSFVFYAVSKGSHKFIEALKIKDPLFYRGAIEEAIRCNKSNCLDALLRKDLWLRDIFKSPNEISHIKGAPLAIMANNRSALLHYFMENPPDPNKTYPVPKGKYYPKEGMWSAEKYAKKFAFHDEFKEVLDFAQKMWAIKRRSAE